MLMNVLKRVTIVTVMLHAKIIMALFTVPVNLASQEMELIVKVSV